MIAPAALEQGSAAAYSAIAGFERQQQAPSRDPVTVLERLERQGAEHIRQLQDIGRKLSNQRLVVAGIH